MRRGTIVAITFAIVAILVFTVSVLAHRPSASLDCENGLQVHLEKYQGRKANHVTIVLDGIVLEDASFYGTYHLIGYDRLDSFVGHVASVDVMAWDDPRGTKGWSVSYYFELEPCDVKPSESPSEAPSQAPTPGPSPEATPTQEPPTEAPTLPPTDT